MNTKTITKLQDFIKKIKSNDEYELELRYTDNISEDTYKKVIESFKNKQLKMTETTTFDINFINKNTNYRITIDGENVENYSKTNKITKEMIKEFIIKQPVDTPITIKTSNLKFNLKEEKPITDESTIKSLLSILSKTSKGFRYKTRTSFICDEFSKKSAVFLTWPLFSIHFFFELSLSHFVQFPFCHKFFQKDS